MKKEQIIEIVVRILTEESVVDYGDKCKEFRSLPESEYPYVAKQIADELFNIEQYDILKSFAEKLSEMKPMDAEMAELSKKAVDEMKKDLPNCQPSDTKDKHKTISLEQVHTIFSLFWKTNDGRWNVDNYTDLIESVVGKIKRIEQDEQKAISLSDDEKIRSESFKHLSPISETTNSQRLKEQTKWIEGAYWMKSHTRAAILPTDGEIKDFADSEFFPLPDSIKDEKSPLTVGQVITFRKLSIYDGAKWALTHIKVLDLEKELVKYTMETGLEDEKQAIQIVKEYLSTYK